MLKQEMMQNNTYTRVQYKLMQNNQEEAQN